MIYYEVYRLTIVNFNNRLQLNLRTICSGIRVGSHMSMTCSRKCSDFFVRIPVILRQTQVIMVLLQGQCVCV